MGIQFDPTLLFDIIIAVVLFGLSYVLFAAFATSVQTFNEKVIKSDKQRKREEDKKIRKAG